MTATRRPGLAGAGRRPQPEADETLDRASRLRDEHNRPVSSQTRPTSNRCGGQPWIGMLADIASEQWLASGWKSAVDFAGTHSLQLTADPSSAVGRSSR